MKTRTLELIRKLLSLDYPVSLDQLAEEFNSSTRTIRNELNEINDFLTRLELNPIQTIRNKGILLLLSPSERVLLLDELSQMDAIYLNREERAYDLLLAMTFSRQPLFLNQKEASYEISKSTMDEDMRRLRSDINKYGLEILRSGKQGIKLHGPERAIRTMIFDIINQQIGLFQIEENGQHVLPKRIFYRYIEKEDCLKIRRILQSELPQIQNDLYFNQILLFTIIWVKRLEMKERIVAINWLQDELEDNEVVNYVARIAKEFSLEVPAVEVNYLEFIIKSLNFRDLSNSLEWVNAQLLSIQLIQFVETETKIPFSKKEDELCEGLYKHLASLANRVKSGIQVLNPIKETIRKNYGQIYEAVKNFSATIGEVLGQPISEDEIAFLVIHFSTALSSLNNEMTFSYKSVVVCNHGVATGNLLAANLKEKFPEIDIVAVLSSQEVNLIPKLDVDLVFSTYEINLPDTPVLLVQPIINEENDHVIRHFLRKNDQFKRIVLENSNGTLLFNQLLELIKESGGHIDGQIYQSLEQVFSQNKFVINSREIQPMLKDVLADSHIQLKIPVNNWEQAIEVVAQPLLKDQIIEKRYVDAMIGTVKEYGPYIVIGKHLALAHARPEDGAKRLGVSVATIAPAIDFGHTEMDPVKIIFCLAAVDSYSHLTIMKELIALINDEAKLARLIHCDEIPLFKEILLNDSNEEDKKRNEEKQ